MTKEEDIDELLRLWAEADPDPVDAFEDQLAQGMGLNQGPGCQQDRWRRLRVQFINANTDTDGGHAMKGPTGGNESLKPERVQRDDEEAGAEPLQRESAQEEDEAPEGGDSDPQA